MVEEKDMVWVASNGNGLADVSFVVSTSLKGLCEEIGFPYGTAKRKWKGGKGCCMTGSGFWNAGKVRIRKVGGRGSEEVGVSKKGVDSFDEI